MNKKLISGAIAALVITCYSSVAFAGTVINITRPEGDEVTYNQTYMICGNTDKSDVTVEVTVYDPSTDSYKPLYTSDNEYAWSIGESGMFMKEVTLPYYDANRMKIVSYSRSAADTQQVDKFTITVLRDGIKEKIVNGIYKIKGIFGGEIFN